MNRWDDGDELRSSSRKNWLQTPLPSYSLPWKNSLASLIYWRTLMVGNPFHRKEIVNSKLATDNSRETLSPNGWGGASLQDLVESTLGGEWGEAPSTPPAPNTVLVKVVRGTEFRRWAKEKGTTAALRQISISSLQKRQLREGDIIVEISGGGPDQPVGGLSN